MNKELEKICHKNNYDKIYSIIESKTIRPSLQYKDLHLSNADLDYLKKYTEESVMCFLHREEPVPAALVNLTRLLGHDQVSCLKFAVTSYIVAQALAELNQFITVAFCGLNSLKQIYVFLEGLVEKINDKYHSLPPEWNIELKLVSRAFVMIKQRICDHFFAGEFDEESYVRGLFATIAFEKKLRPFFETKNCCFHQIEFKNDQIRTESKMPATDCIHTRMLSSIFLSHINLYFAFCFKPFMNMHFDQSVCKMSIVEIFLSFFREVGHVYEKTSYFEDACVFKEMLLQIDFCLCSLVKKLKVEDRLPRAAVVVGTVIYIQETAHDLVEKVYGHCEVNSPMGIFGELARLEKAQSSKIEKFIAQSFVSLKKGASNFEALRGWFDAFIAGMGDVSEELKDILVEMAMSQFFVRVSLIKMSLGTAEALLSDACDLELYLEKRLPVVPHIRSVKEYLKIFMCPTDDKVKFVDNFRILSGNVFNFYQILNALESQEDAAELFLQYKKSVR